ncbi:MAG: hypothetical protein IPJ89_05330 [Candidatus Iainarchaeum archaeon]|uniref:Uncharacterized protein n=1 Tax=Candidatus Iainarchaeum sp. TaxID=3101447 RepID=A0A7T9DJL1_9ARCH|nr:MAG: hypothetical protein IPJ89_05330 [Candidatus Diapherotrites archaeon]
MPSNAIVLEDVKKLLSLGLSKQQLIQELADIGVPSPEAERLYLEATGQAPFTPIPSPVRNSSFTIAPPNVAPVQSAPKPTPVVIAAPQPSDSLEKLWEKGIIATVDAKLSQMEALKREVDSVIDSKIAQKTSMQEKKIEILFESQRDLTLAKVDAEMGAKVKQIDDALSQKIEEIKRLNLATQEDLQRIKGQRFIMTDLMSDLTTKTAGLDQFRRTLSDDVARKLDQMQTQVNELLQSSESRLSQAEMKATQTLQLEEKIAAGLAQQVEQQANQILESRVKDLRAQLQDEMSELRKLEMQLSPEQVQQRIAEMNKSIDEQIARVQSQFSSKEMEARIAKVMEQKQRTILQYLDAEVEKMKADMESKAKSVQEIVSELNSARASLEEFAQQQRKTIDEYNRESGQSLETRIAQINQVVESKIEGYIDSKEREIMAEVNQQLPQIQAMKSELLERQQNLARLVADAEGVKEGLDALVQKKLQFIDSTIDNKMAALINAKEKELNARVKEGMDDLSRMRSEMTQKSIEVQALKDNMDIFKDQFLSTLKQANIERQDETKVFRQRMTEFDAKADAKINLVDSRLAKLDEIIQQLAQTIQQMQSSAKPPLPASKK